MILVSGAIANKPYNGGEAWVRLSYVFGLRQAGYEVCFVEQIDAAQCVDENGTVVPFETSINLAYFQQVVEQFGLAGTAALVCGAGEATWGIAWETLLAYAEATDALINISGHLQLEPLLCRIRYTLYVDIDPGFTQFWQAERTLPFTLQEHTCYFTVGEHIGTPLCPIPTSGIHWYPTRPPVVLDHWPVAQANDVNRFTSVANWRGPYGPVVYEGVVYGLKVHEFRKFLAFPGLVSQQCELALNIHPADADDRNRLVAHGWKLVEPQQVAPNPLTFREYVQASGAEFSVAQGVYVATHSGWFSDRTVRYLASGKPVLVQDTGFSHNLPVGDGLVAFCTMDEAVDGAKRIARDYDHHCRAAREIAEGWFDATAVLHSMLNVVEMHKK
jgi:hypothetical protein